MESDIFETEVYVQTREVGFKMWGTIPLITMTTLKKKKLREENVVGINCHRSNPSIFVTFSSCENLFSNLLQHIIPATLTFFEKIFFSPSYLSPNIKTSPYEV